MRRCTSESCILAAQDKGRVFHLDLPVVSILHQPARDWKRVAFGSTRIASDRSIDVDWKKYNTDDFLFTHCSIVSSVDVAENGYYIEPPCDELVNSNGNAWSTPVLVSTFRTFVGGQNYYEHIQVPELSKGRILDAVLRPVVYKSKDGERKSSVYYVDILVATERKHGDLVRRIEASELDTLSMGCIAHWVQCSKCGKEISDSMTNCVHLDQQMMDYFVDENGVRRIVAELCGRSYLNDKGERVGDPNSVQFIEASWVEKPAFKGAVINHFISELPKQVAAMTFTADLSDIWEPSIRDLNKLRVADANGMMVLRLAREEIMRQRQLEKVARITERLSRSVVGCG